VQVATETCCRNALTDPYYMQLPVQYVHSSTVISKRKLFVLYVLACTEMSMQAPLCTCRQIHLQTLTGHASTIIYRQVQACTCR
jgi:hypothetical protein